MRPMLATKGDHVPTGEGWVHEVKWDGVRVLGDVRDGAVRLGSRNDNTVTVAWPEVAAPPAAHPDVLVDGEVIALNERGLPDFRTLQDRMHVRDPRAAARLADAVPAVYMVFDVLRLEGHDLMGLPLARRREVLEDLDLAGSSWQVPPTYDDGAMLLDATLAQGLEGVVSKRLASPYVPERRSPHWLKFAHRHRGTFVVGGWRPQEGTVDRLAAVLVGEVTPDGLAYRGRVGSGITGRTSSALAALLAPLAAGASPFDDEVPRLDALGTRWVRPEVVVDVDTHGLGYTRLRQPSFQGVRTDVTPADLARDAVGGRSGPSGPRGDGA